MSEDTERNGAMARHPAGKHGRRPGVRLIELRPSLTEDVPPDDAALQVDVYRTGLDDPVTVRVRHRPTGIVESRTDQSGLQARVAAVEAVRRRLGEERTHEVAPAVLVLECIVCGALLAPGSPVAAAHVEGHRGPRWRRALRDARIRARQRRAERARTNAHRIRTWPLTRAAFRQISSYPWLTSTGRQDVSAKVTRRENRPSPPESKQGE